MSTPSHEWLFRDDGRDFRTKMIEFIRKNFADLLGDDVRLLYAPGGLEILRKRTQEWLGDVKNAHAPA